MKTYIFFLLTLIFIYMEGCKKQSVIKCNLGESIINIEENNIKIIKGKISISVIDNFKEGYSKNLYLLTTYDGKVYELKFCKGVRIPLLKPNQDVRLRGIIKDNKLYVVDILN